MTRPTLGTMTMTGTAIYFRVRARVRVSSVVEIRGSVEYMIYRVLYMGNIIPGVM